MVPSTEVLEELTQTVRKGGPGLFGYHAFHSGQTPEVLGFRPIGAGASRVTFDIGGGLVCKVAFDRTYQSEQEWDIWQKAPKHIKQKLCPIVAHDEVNHCWTIMQKAKHVGPWPSLAYQTRLNKLKDVTYNYGIGDVHGNNVGYLGRKLVVLDYGF